MKPLNKKSFRQFVLIALLCLGAIAGLAYTAYGTTVGTNVTTASLFATGSTGIGTTTPATLLEVQGLATSTLTITTASSTPQDPVLSFRTGANPSENFKIYVDDSDSDKLVIATSTGSNLLTITQGGNVGIGTATPSQKLDVTGNINLNTNGTNALFSTYKGANSDGYNLFIGGGGQSSVGEVGKTYEGSYNTANGVDALYSNTLGASNTANGVESLYYNTTGNENVANGAYALYSNTTGGYNTANGAFAFYDNTSGSNNTVNGASSLNNNTTGNYNTSDGSQSLNYNETGSNNVAMGYYAGFGVINSSNISNSVLLGYEAGKALLTAGSNNILIGYKAGDALTTGAKNIVIGYDIDVPAVSSANTLNIGNFIYATGLDGSGTTLSAGKMGIGTSTPVSALSVSSSATTTFEVYSSSATKGGCLKIKDDDGSGFTYCVVNNGAMTCSVTSCE